MDLITTLDKSKIYLIDDKKNYRIRYNGVDKLLFMVKNIYSPFGVEKYNNKDILNLEIENNSNYNNNIISLLKELDEYFNDLTKTDQKFFHLNYTSFLKNNGNNKFIIRTHLSKKLKIKAKNNDPKSIIFKNNSFSIELEFSNVWVYNNSFGLILTVNLIDFN